MEVAGVQVVEDLAEGCGVACRGAVHADGAWPQVQHQGGFGVPGVQVELLGGARHPGDVVAFVAHLGDRAAECLEVAAVGVDEDHAVGPGAHRADQLDEHQSQGRGADRAGAGKRLVFPAGAVGQCGCDPGAGQVPGECCGDCLCDGDSDGGVGVQGQVGAVLFDGADRDQHERGACCLGGGRCGEVAGHVGSPSVRVRVSGAEVVVEAVRHDHVLLGEVVDGGDPQTQQCGVDASAAHVEDVLHAALTSCAAAPQVGRAHV